MTWTMLDALNPNNIPLPLPRGATGVAGYIDLADAWPPGAWIRFSATGAICLQICRDTSNNAGDFLDVENGLNTQTLDWQTRVPAWIKMRRARFVNAGIYCSESLWPAVQIAVSAAGLTNVPYWVAAYPGAGPTIPAGAIGHQYEDAGPYDVSVMDDSINEEFFMSVDPTWTTPIDRGNIGSPVPGTPTVTGQTTPLDVMKYFDSNAADIIQAVVNAQSALSAQLTQIETAVAALTPQQLSDGPYYLTSTPPAAT